MKVRRTPSVATAISLIALFVALGGTSYAVTSSINGSQIKNRSIGGTKLKKHAVNGTDVSVGSFPQVPSAHKADLATNATNATHANNATNATTATKAGTITGSITGSQVSSAVANATNAVTAQNVGGHSFTDVDSSCANAGTGNCASTGSTILNDFNGLTIKMTCPGTTGLDLQATSADTGASFGIGATEVSGAANAFGADGNLTTVDDNMVSTPAQVHFAYVAETGSLIFHSFHYVTGSLSAFNTAGTCSVWGQAQQDSTSPLLFLAKDKQHR